MIYVYECTHPDCGATTERIRMVAEADLPVPCPCSGSHETRRVRFPGGVGVHYHGRGFTKNVVNPEWAAKVDRQYREAQIKQTMEETL